MKTILDELIATYPHFKEDADDLLRNHQMMKDLSEKRNRVVHAVLTPDFTRATFVLKHRDNITPSDEAQLSELLQHGGWQR